MAREHTLDRLLRAWREDIDSEPFPVIADVNLPRQTRRQLRADPNRNNRPDHGRPPTRNH
ncbi:MAG: hypothetical protein GEU98_22740 [Pseudonocardiaceae bacterium]|nr:hypothetical protein [Pseudonocardiaceae bacterium]